MAAYYDEFSAHHDYELWLSHLLPAANDLGLQGTRLLDVACGTGKSFAPLVATEWQITACDISRGMLDQAKTRAADSVRLEQTDMRELPIFGAFDLVWALGDPFNYLSKTSELEACLRGMRANLAPGGVVLFDLNTLLTYGTFYVDTSTRRWREKLLVWRGLTAPDPAPGVRAQASFEVFEGSMARTHHYRPGGHQRRESIELLDGSQPFCRPICRALHEQRHFRVSEVLDAIDRAGLECVAVFGQHFDAVLHEDLDETKHTKAVYFARDPDETQRR